MSMLERTVSLWRRMVCGRSQRDALGGPAVAEDDRRVWVRHSTDAEITCLPTGTADGSLLSARVRNVSLGGMNLIVNRAFQTGDLLCVELPTLPDQTATSVLACVVHVNAEPDGEWSVGCNFSAELDDDDLRALGGRRVRPTPPDSRNWQRFPSNVRATYALATEEMPQREPAKVLNISASGVGLLVEQRIEPGTLLSVDLLSGDGRSATTVLACVVHLTEQASDGWALGCNFIQELSASDLQGLL